MFGFHPVNLGFRLILELAALVSIGLGAVTLTEGLLRWGLAIGLPLVAAVIWGVFNVPGDRSRSGEAPVPVPGVVRLLIELAVFGAGVVLLLRVTSTAAVILGVAVAAHYLLSMDRIRWLFTN